MSLDVYLTEPRQEPARVETAAAILRANGFEDFAQELEARHEHGPRELYSANITHNLNLMADAAGIYKHLWRPDEIGITKASQLIEPLREGLAKLQANREHYEQFNASNGWGLYEHFVPFVSAYMSACEDHPNADVGVSR